MLLAIQDFDKSVYLWLNKFQKNVGLIRIFRLVSHSGDGYMYAAIAVFVFLNNTVSGTAFFACTLAAFLIEIPAFIALKKLIKRDRPFVSIEGSSFSILPSDKFSLPSGHSAAAFLMASLVAGFYPNFSLLAYCWAALIGSSRVMLGVHYPTDIVAGALLGISCSALSFTYIL